MIAVPTLRWLAVALLAATLAPPALAQELLSGDEQNLVNFAFATKLGSGVYAVSGRTLQIYRLRFGYTLQSADEANFGIALTLPVTFGFYDFELQDVADGKLPTSVDSLSFVPGLKLVFEPRPDWNLEPFVEAGLSRARDADADAWVYAGGLRSLYEFDGPGFKGMLYNELGYAGADFRGTSRSDHFTRLQTALTARRPFTRGSKVDYLVYAMNEIYVGQPGGPVDSAAQRGSAVQYEIGITLGTTETRRVWGVPLPRVGIGYRFGSSLDVIRVVFGTPY